MEKFKILKVIILNKKKRKLVSSLTILYYLSLIYNNLRTVVDRYKSSNVQ